jgi:hypothetical protein
MSAVVPDVPQFTRPRRTRPAWLSALNLVGGPLRRALRPDAGKWLAQALDTLPVAPGPTPVPEQPVVEALEQLVDSLRGDARLSFMGCLTARDETIRLLQQHLQLGRRLAAQPDVLETPLPPPVFIIGLPRTGSTFLHHLLAADARNRTMPYWESYEPLPPLSGADRRAERVARMLGQLQRLAPAYQAIHPMTADGPEECVALFMNVLRSLQFDIQYRVPGYVAWLLAQDATVAYRAYRKQLHVVQFYRPAGERFLLKDPTHACHLPALLEVFPDAKFVFTHRHPVSTFSSICSLYAYTRSIFSDRVDPVALGREVRDGYWPVALAQLQAARDSLPSSRYIDIRQRDLAAAPIETAARIYAHFGFDFGDAGRRALAAFVAGQSATFRGRHAHSLAGFGLSDDEFNARFAAYIEDFDLDG